MYVHLPYVHPHVLSCIYMGKDLLTLPIVRSGHISFFYDPFAPVTHTTLSCIVDRPTLLRLGQGPAAISFFSIQANVSHSIDLIEIKAYNRPVHTNQ